MRLFLATGTWAGTSTRLCPPGLFPRYCIQDPDGDRKFHCPNVPELKQDCRFANLTGIRTLVFPEWEGDVNNLQKFATIVGLHRIELIHWKDPIAFHRLIQTFPTIKEVSFVGSEMQQLRAVPVQSLLETIYSMGVSMFDGRLADLNLPHLKSLRIFMTTSLEIGQLQDLDVESLTVHNNFDTSADWDIWANPQTLKHLRVIMPRLSDELQDFPFNNFETLILQGHRLRINPRNFANNKPFPYLKRLVINGLHLNPRTKFSASRFPYLEILEINDPWNFFEFLE